MNNVTQFNRLYNNKLGNNIGSYWLITILLPLNMCSIVCMRR